MKLIPMTLEDWLFADQQMINSQPQIHDMLIQGISQFYVEDSVVLELEDQEIIPSDLDRETLDDKFVVFTTDDGLVHVYICFLKNEIQFFDLKIKDDQGITEDYLNKLVPLINRLVYNGSLYSVDIGSYLFKSNGEFHHHVHFSSGLKISNLEFKGLVPSGLHSRRYERFITGPVVFNVPDNTIVSGLLSVIDASLDLQIHIGNNVTINTFGLSPAIVQIGENFRVVQNCTVAGTPSPLLSSTAFECGMLYLMEMNEPATLDLKLVKLSSAIISNCYHVNITNLQATTVTLFNSNAIFANCETLILKATRNFDLVLAHSKCKTIQLISVDDSRLSTFKFEGVSLVEVMHLSNSTNAPIQISGRFAVHQLEVKTLPSSPESIELPEHTLVYEEAKIPEEYELPAYFCCLGDIEIIRN